MEDRLKFRVWNTETKEMKECGQINIVYEALCSTVTKNLDTIHYLFHPHKRLIQCTGLKDKNGKLIYEKDIVKIKCVSPWGEELEAVGYVYYDRCAYWVNFKNHSSELYCEDATYEVLGNVWENPELLESKA